MLPLWIYSNSDCKDKQIHLFANHPCNFKEQNIQLGGLVFGYQIYFDTAIQQTSLLCC
jgi:hypothetical protein